MKLKQLRSHNLQTFLAIFLFALALVGAAWGDDKHKDSSTPKSAPKSAPAAHSSSGGGGSHHSANTGRTSGGSNTGRSAGGNSGRSGGGYNQSHSSNSGQGRQGSSNGSAGNIHGSSNSGGNGRPGGTRTSHGESNSSKGGNGTGHGSGGPGSGGPRNSRTTRGSGHDDDHGSSRDSRNARSGSGKEERRADGDHRGPAGHHEMVRHESRVGDRRVARDDRGRVRDIHGRGVDIHRDFHGDRRFEATHNGRRVVGYGRGHGFTERAYLRRGGRVYVQRTYIYGGRRYAYAYRSYYYHGVGYFGYAPAFYYHPVFYGWAFNPWVSPVYYRWGWYGDPWYRGYGYYFNPYPVYPSASLWLTDYLLAENLRLAYEARANAEGAGYEQSVDEPSSGGGQAALSPEVKQLIANEVQRQLAEERAAAAQPSPGGQAQGGNDQAPEEAPAALDPNQRVFIVAGNVDLVGDAGECAVTAGDVLLRTGTAPDANNRIAVSVVSSKRGNCPANTNSEVEVTELQEMHNQFREKMDSGLKALADNQGKNGLPQAPDTGTTAGEVPPPTADADADAELQNQQKNADQEEHKIQKAGPGPG
jgi:hypothetical protein